MDDPQYHPLYQKAIDLNNKFNDFTGGNHGHPEAAALQHEVRQLIEDVEVKKNPRTIENRIKTIQHQLKQSQNMSHSYMDYNHYDYLHDNYEFMRRDLRKFNNY